MPQCQQSAYGFIYSILNGEVPLWPDAATPAFADNLQQELHLQGLYPLIYHLCKNVPAWKTWPADIRERARKTAFHHAAHDLAVETKTEKGESLMKGSKAEAADDLGDKIAAAVSAVKEDLAMPVSAKELPALLTGKEKDPMWGKRAEKCFSCGSCVLVCPTCYCFDVTDELELSLEGGQRVRSWDGCTIENFATVAGEHNFREKVADRLRHRIFRKGKYLMERWNMAGCVGCGRGSKTCVANIATPVKIKNELREGGR